MDWEKRDPTRPQRRAAGVRGLRVDCYAGYRGEQTPRRFWLGCRAMDVEAVLDAWLCPDHRYFKVKATDQALYILRHDPEADRWDLVFFKAADP